MFFFSRRWQNLSNSGVKPTVRTVISGCYSRMSVWLITVIKENHATCNNPLVVRKGADFHSLIDNFILPTSSIKQFLKRKEEKNQPHFRKQFLSYEIWTSFLIKLKIHTSQYLYIFVTCRKITPTNCKCESLVLYVNLLLAYKIEMWIMKIESMLPESETPYKSVFICHTSWYAPIITM